MNTVKRPKKSRITLSPNMYQMLRFCAENDVTLTDLRRVNQSTLRACLKREAIERVGNSVPLTRFGRVSLEQYGEGRLPERGFERDLTDHVKSLLKLVRAKSARKLIVA